MMLEVAWTSLCFDLKSLVLGLSFADLATEVVLHFSLQPKLHQRQELHLLASSRVVLH